MSYCAPERSMQYFMFEVKIKSNREKKDNILQTINNFISEVNFKNTTISQDMRKAENQ